MNKQEIQRIEKAMRRFVSACKEGGGVVDDARLAATYATFEEAVEGFANDLHAAAQ